MSLLIWKSIKVIIIDYVTQVIRDLLERLN